MKKHMITILSGILLLVSFVFFWYKDQLFDFLSIFYLVPLFILVVSFISLLVISFIKLFKEKEKIYVITIVLLIVTAIIVIFFPFREAKISFELNFLESKRLEIVDLIKKNKISYQDNTRNVKLPFKYIMCSTSGEVFVYENDDNNQVIGFWIVRGMLSDSIEIIYSTGGEELIRENALGHPIKEITYLKDNWYLVYRNY